MFVGICIIRGLTACLGLNISAEKKKKKILCLLNSCGWTIFCFNNLCGQIKILYIFYKNVFMDQSKMYEIIQDKEIYLKQF